MPWFKLWTDIISDERMHRLSHPQFRFWIYLLAYAKEQEVHDEKERHCNALIERHCNALIERHSDVTVTREIGKADPKADSKLHIMLIPKLNIKLTFQFSLEKIQSMLAEFEHLGLIKILSEDSQVIKISIVNWYRRQYSKSTLRTRRWRHRNALKKRHCNVSVTGESDPPGDGEKRRENKREKLTPKLEHVAEQIYAIYPRKAGGREKSLTAIRKALHFISPEELLSLTQEYAASAYVQTAPRHLIPHATTWFNQRRWETDREEWHTPYQGSSFRALDKPRTQEPDAMSEIDLANSAPRRVPTPEEVAWINAEVERIKHEYSNPE